MMKRFSKPTLTLLLLALAGLTLNIPPLTGFARTVGPSDQPDPDYSGLRATLMTRFGNHQPLHWGERINGVARYLATGAPVVALTFDACGSSPASKGYDAELIDFLVREKVPATLFLTALWIEANPQLARQLAASPLFEIENHGLMHRPASVNGQSAYGIAGTANVGELVDEVELNARKLKELTGKKPRFYRSGTAFYDEVAVQVISALGYQAVNFSVLGDAGATFNRDQVKQALLNAKPGAIVICHMNHPESDTAEGVMAAVPELKKRGIRFVRLGECLLK